MQRPLLVLLWAAFFVAACNPTGKPTYPERRGGRGEACLVTNDCKEPLLCFSGRCLDEELAFEPTAKVCVSAECIDDKDCCAPLTKSEQAECDEYADCLQQGSEYCSPPAASCECLSKCVDHLCTNHYDECTSNVDCWVGTCKQNRCVECSKDAECGTGLICEENNCRTACRRDEDCGALAACSAGRCQERGCESDRECALLLGARDAVCKDGKCGHPCKNDAQCAFSDELSTCSGGLCKFVGCETNAECAALHGSSFGSLALCLSQAEANKVR